MLPRGIYRASIKLSRTAKEPVTIAYFEYTAGKPSPIGWKMNPENTLELLTSEGTSAENLEEGKRIAVEVLEKLASGELKPEKKPYSPPTLPERVAEVSHTEKPLKAIVLKWPDEYEVRTIGYVRDGFTLPVQSPSITQDPDYEWGRLDVFERLLADTEEEAIEAAREELENLSRQDIPFKEN